MLHPHATSKAQSGSITSLLEHPRKPECLAVCLTTRRLTRRRKDKDKDDDIDLEPSTHDVGFAMSSDEFCNRESVARKSTVRITNRRAGT